MTGKTTKVPNGPAPLTVTGALPVQPNLATPPAIFRSPEPVKLILESDFTALASKEARFSVYLKNLANGQREEPLKAPGEDLSHAPGRVGVPGANDQLTWISVEVEDRGQTSISDLPGLPKLRVTLAKDPAAKHAVKGTLLEGVHSLNIGTHGGNSVQLTPMGRLANDLSPFRESALYQVIDAFGVTVPDTAPALIRYQQDEGTQLSDLATEHHAMLLERFKALAKRLGGTHLDTDNGWTGTIKGNVGEEVAARLELCLVMTGVLDTKFGDTTDGGELWNVQIVELPSGQQIPVLYDFDTASWVTGAAIETGLRRDGSADRLAQMKSGIADIKDEKRYSRGVLDRVRNDLLARADSARSRLAAQPMDDEGRKIANEHLEAFLAALKDVHF